MTTITLASPPPTIKGIKFNNFDYLEVVDEVVDKIGIGKGGDIITPNLSIMRQAKSQSIADQINDAKIVVCDGMPVLIAAKVAGVPLRSRVAGSTLLYKLSARAADASLRVAYIGGADGVPARAAAEMRRIHPSLQVVATHSPPWGFEKNPSEVSKLIELLIKSEAQIVFLGLGSMKQETLAKELMKNLPHVWFVNCGAAISFAAGETRRAPMLFQRLGLEWAHRLAHEPRRLGPRYWEDAKYLGPLFLWAVKYRFTAHPNRRKI